MSQYYNISDHSGQSSPVLSPRQSQLSLQDDQGGCSEAEDTHVTSPASAKSRPSSSRRQANKQLKKVTVSSTLELLDCNNIVFIFMLHVNYK